MQYSITGFDFRYTISKNYPNGMPYIYFYPENEYFGFYAFAFNSLIKVTYLISGFENVLATGISQHLPGEEESFFDVSIKHTALVVTLPGYYESPVYVDTATFLKVLIEYREWLIMLESCQIPGIIPPSKLDTWSCVPNEYVKPEYWDLLKQQQESKK